MFCNIPKHFIPCLFLALLLSSCGYPNIESLKQDGDSFTRLIATNEDEAFACLRFNVFDGEWVNSVDKRSFIVGNVNRPGNVSAISELSFVETNVSKLTCWYSSHVGWKRIDELIVNRCHGIKEAPEGSALDTRQK